MCLIAFAWRVSEQYPFLIAANRDEYLARPTATLSSWRSAKGRMIHGGRDLREGGTWMGFTDSGRFAMLTNVRDPGSAVPPDAISRGRLVLDWLESDADLEDWAARLMPTRYAGFNLIVGNWAVGHCAYATNQIQPAAPTPNGLYLQHLAAGEIYGLSNAALDTPWPKTVFLKKAVQQAMAQHTSVPSLAEQCLQALADRRPVSDHELPQTGVPLDWERALASPFVRFPPAEPAQYGTRTSMVAVLAAGHGLHLEEITHPSAHTPPGRAQLSLSWV